MLGKIVDRIVGRKKLDLDYVEEAILNSIEYPPGSCLRELRDCLNDLGCNFPETRKGERKAYKEALKYWWDIREKRSPLDKVPDYNPEDDLPGSVVDGKYFIYGVIHKQLGGASEEVKNFFRKKASRYHPGSRLGNKVLLCESGIDEQLGIEFLSYDFFDYGVYSDRDRLNLLARLPQIICVRLFEKTVGKAKKRVRESVRWRFAYQRGIKHFNKMREVAKRIVLPEPLTLDYCSDSWVSNIMNGKSLYMAKKMTEFANNEFEEVHAIVGYAHEPQIEYFLHEFSRSGKWIELK
jgi:hypothetical protein